MTISRDLLLEIKWYDHVTSWNSSTAQTTMQISFCLDTFFNLILLRLQKPILLKKAGTRKFEKHCQVKKTAFSCPFQKEMILTFAQ